MKIKDEVYIFQDGKLCRGIKATVLALRSGGVRVTFDTEGTQLDTWCRRRNKKGLYEAIGWNYWLLPKYSVTGYQTQLET